MRRLRRWRLGVVGAAWGLAEPLGFGLLVYATYRWQELLGIALAGGVLIGYGAMRRD